MGYLGLEGTLLSHRVVDILLRFLHWLPWSLLVFCKRHCRVSTGLGEYTVGLWPQLFCRGVWASQLADHFYLASWLITRAAAIGNLTLGVHVERGRLHVGWLVGFGS